MQSQQEAEPDVKKPGIAQFIEQEIDRKGLKPPEFKSEGASEFSRTNEKVKPETLKTTRESEQPPNGYIIGVGVPNLFSMLDAFPEGAEPKGIVMVNTDPNTISDTTVFLEELRKGRLVKFHGSGKSQEIYHESDKASNEPYSLEAGYQAGENTVDTYTVMRKHAVLLIKMAREGKISLVHQDILNPELLDILAELPDYKDSNNVVYLSNIADWIWRGEANRLLYSDKHFMMRALSNPYAQIPEDIDISQIFKGFENLERVHSILGHKTYFIDTLQRNLKYVLRVGDKPPVFGRGDFNILAS